MTNNKSLSHLSQPIISLVEKAAISCYDWIGRGKEKLADAAAVESMRGSLNSMNIDGTIVIGEGERDEAPMLYIGEKVGLKKDGNIEVDIALDPLEGTTICANGSENSLAVIAFANKGKLLYAPDVYMDKIVVGGGLPDGIVNLDNSVKENLTNLASAKKCDISDLTAMILTRDRHKELISKVREVGARIKFIDDGDIAAAISCCDPRSKIDIYMGIGGAPEGVLAAAALRTVGGQIMGRLIFNDDKRQIDRAKKMGISDINKKYNVFDMTGGKDSQVIFACSGVTDGQMLLGVKKKRDKTFVSSLLMDSSEKKIIKTSSEFLK